MHPSHIALSDPRRAAVIMAGSGETLTYEAMEAHANQGAQLFRALGLVRGDVIAVCLENTPAIFEVAWAAQRAGLHWTCISSRLNASEVEYIVRDCGAKHMIIASTLTTLVSDLIEALANDVHVFLSVEDEHDLRSFQLARAEFPTTPINDPSAGMDMLYSSGTTGQPKGVVQPLPEGPFDGLSPLAALIGTLFGFGGGGVYLSPAPLYHAAPLRWAMAVQRLGGTVVVMQKFDPEAALQLIEQYNISYAQFVPTHFIRMLKLSDEVRLKHDVSSLRSVVHAAAPCPIHVKASMIQWWGPILHEYYAGTESNGMTYINSKDWLAHPGSVGRALTGVLHICDEAGDELPPRTDGLVTFEGGPNFTYHNDPKKTAESRNKRGWTSLGDIGWVDEEGYLYLTDRKSFMIISGGVNIYPQEIENALIAHPKIADVAVVGGPDPDMGETVVAVVQPADGVEPNAALANELETFAREHLASYKVPRRIEFSAELPRHATGKLYKRFIRDRLWASPSVVAID